MANPKGYNQHTGPGGGKTTASGLVVLMPKKPGVNTYSHAAHQASTNHMNQKALKRAFNTKQ